MRRCPICSLKNLAELNKRLTAGENITELAKERKLSYQTLARHARCHIPALFGLVEDSRKRQMAEEIHAKRIEMADDLLDILNDVRKELYDDLNRSGRGAREPRIRGMIISLILQMVDRFQRFFEQQRFEPAPHTREVAVQQIRDLYGLTDAEMPRPCNKAITAEVVHELPAHESEPEPEGAELRYKSAPPADDQPKPVPPVEPKESAASSISSLGGTHDPTQRSVAERRELDRIHREGRRAEVGELSKLVN